MSRFVVHSSQKLYINFISRILLLRKNNKTMVNSRISAKRLPNLHRNSKKWVRRAAAGDLAKRISGSRRVAGKSERLFERSEFSEPPQ